MKILYLDLNILYHNPTKNNIVLLLKSIGDLYLYGPGYQSKDTLEEGIEKYYLQNGPFDFIITNEHIIFNSQNIEIKPNITIKGFQTNYYSQFDEIEIKKFLYEAFDFFYKIKDIKKAVFLLESDYYNFQKSKIERLEKLDPYIIGWGKDFVAHTDYLEELYKESFGNSANNNWYYFIQNYAKMIQIPHFVNSNEFYFETIFNRKNTIYVAGTNYYQCKKVIEVVKNSKYNIDDKKIYNKIYSVMRKIGIKPDAHPILMRLYNILFRTKLEYSKYVFTCGSGLEWPIRKFFEIPAIGSLLLAKPFYNAEKLGFVDGENYIGTNYKNIIEKLDWLENNKIIAQQIATKGQNMIWENHSIEARIRQLRESFEAILDNSFSGTYWEDGEFYVRKYF